MRGGRREHGKGRREKGFFPRKASGARANICFRTSDITENYTQFNYHISGALYTRRTELITAAGAISHTLLRTAGVGSGVEMRFLTFFQRVVGKTCKRGDLSWLCSTALYTLTAVNNEAQLPLNNDVYTTNSYQHTWQGIHTRLMYDNHDNLWSIFV